MRQFELHPPTGLLIRLRQANQTHTVVNAPIEYAVQVGELAGHTAHLTMLWVVGENRYKWQTQTVLFWE